MCSNITAEKGRWRGNCWCNSSLLLRDASSSAFPSSHVTHHIILPTCFNLPTLRSSCLSTGKVVKQVLELVVEKQQVYVTRTEVSRLQRVASIQPLLSKPVLQMKILWMELHIKSKPLPKIRALLLTVCPCSLHGASSAH